MKFQTIAIMITMSISSVFFAHSTKADEPASSTPQTVIECLGIPEAEASDWQGIQGFNIWLGYPTKGETPAWGIKHGFAWPNDVQSDQLITLSTSVGERYVLIVSSQLTPDTYYILPFISMEPYADSDGNYYGAHPCGAFSVSGDLYTTTSLETLQNFDSMFRDVWMKDQDENMLDTLLSAVK